MKKKIKPKASNHMILATSIFLARLIAYIPMPVLLFIGRIIGFFSYYLAKKRRKIVERNIELCFPNLSQNEQTNLVKDNFLSMGMAIFEVVAAWWKPDRQVKKLFIYQGLEHIENLRKNGIGALLTTLHFCPLELGGRAIALKTNLHGMYRQHKNEYYEYVQYDMRKKQTGFDPMTRNEIRKLIRCLKEGKLVWYAPDQNYGGTDHVFIPFFGVNALTITATSTLTRLGKAKVLPYYCYRKKGKYIVNILPPLDNFPTKDLKADTLRLNQLFESWIMEAPEQYLWAHRRFKSRPEGEESLY